MGSLLESQHLAQDKNGVHAVYTISSEQKCCMPCWLLFLVYDFSTAADLQLVLTVAVRHGATLNTLARMVLKVCAFVVQKMLKPGLT